MKLIVGLGNPGRQYARTRHNIGYLSVDRLASAYNIGLTYQEIPCVCGTGTVADTHIILAKPMTYMNNSGQAVFALMRHCAATPADIVIIHDDMDFEFGKLKLKLSGGSAGHRGVMSTINHLQTNTFTRLRVGIGKPPAAADPVDYVLQQFTANEQQQLDVLLDTIVSCITMMLKDGIEKTMNVFHASDKTA